MAADRCAIAVASVELFNGLGSDACARLAEDSELLEFGPGEVICREGDPGTGLHVAVEGQVKLLLQAGNGHEKVFDLIGPGGCFGEPSLYTELPHLVTAQAIVPSRILHVGRPAMMRLVREESEFALRVIRNLAGRIYRRTSDLKSYMLMTGTQRVICYLLHGVPDEEPGPAGVAVTLPVRKHLIASRLNLTQEHFSRILRELTESALIRVDGHRVHIRDVGRLRAAAMA